MYINRIDTPNVAKEETKLKKSKNIKKEAKREDRAVEISIVDSVELTRKDNDDENLEKDSKKKPSQKRLEEETNSLKNINITV